MTAIGVDVERVDGPTKVSGGAVTPGVVSASCGWRKSSRLPLAVV